MISGGTAAVNVSSELMEMVDAPSPSVRLPRSVDGHNHRAESHIRSSFEYDGIFGQDHALAVMALNRAARASKRI